MSQPPRDKRSSARPWIQAAIGGIAGFLVWAFSETVTGRVEPWDSQGLWYVGVLGLAGLVAAVVDLRTCWIGVIGCYFAQVFYYALYGYTLSADVLVHFRVWVAVAVFGIWPFLCGIAVGAPIGLPLLFRRSKTTA